MEGWSAWELLHSVALIAGGLFAGVLLYTATIGHRIRLAMGPPVGLTHFRASLSRTERIQPPLHVICLLSTIALLAHAPSGLLLAALLAMAPILPVSVGLMLPLNAKLTDPALAPEAVEATAMLERWGRLHLVRASFAICGFVLLALL